MRANPPGPSLKANGSRIMQDIMGKLGKPGLQSLIGLLEEVRAE
jgi:hypothetical protein